MLSNLSNRKKIIIASIVFIFGLLLIFLTSSIVNRNENNAPASNFVPSNAPATLLKAESIYKSLEINQYEQLRNDLTNYARNYKHSEDQVVTYELVSSVTSEGSTLKFELESKNKPGHTLIVKLDKKTNQRIGLSFTDKKLNSADFDASLSSNSVRNDYITTLPIQRASYTIDYNQQENKFVVYLYDKDVSLREAAVQEIKQNTKEDIDQSDYDLIVPGVFEDDGFGEPVDGVEGD